VATSVRQDEALILRFWELPGEDHSFDGIGGTGFEDVGAGLPAPPAAYGHKDPVGAIVEVAVKPFLKHQTLPDISA
jgi:hypothetical protein